MKKLFLLLAILPSLLFAQGVLQNDGNTIKYSWGSALQNTMDKSGLSCRQFDTKTLQFLQTNKVILAVDYSTLTTPSYSTIDSVFNEIAGWLASYKVDSAVYSDTSKAIKNAGVTTASDSKRVYLYANTNNGALYFKDSSGTAILSATSDTLKTTGAIRTGGSILMNATSPNNKIGTTNGADVVFIANNTEAMSINSSTRNVTIGMSQLSNNFSVNASNPTSTGLTESAITRIVSTSNNSLVLENNGANSAFSGGGLILTQTASNPADGIRLGSIQFRGRSNNNLGASIQSVGNSAWTSGGNAGARLEFLTTTSATSSTVLRCVMSDGKVGLGSGANAAPTTPTYNLSWNGNATYTIGGERHTTANTAGNSTTFRGIGATSGANNKSGGDLIFMSGEKTGVFSSGAIRMQTYGSSAAATADNVSYDRMVVLSTEALKDNTLDTLFSVVLGADSIFTSSMKFAVTVMDADSAQMETGDVIFQYLRNGNKGAIATASVTSVKGKEIAGETDVATTFSYIYAHATSTLYVCVKVDTPTGNNLNTYANIGFNGTILGMGGRYTTLTQY